MIREGPAQPNCLANLARFQQLVRLGVPYSRINSL